MEMNFSGSNINVCVCGTQERPSQNEGLLALLSLNELFRKRTETDVAFTLEYFWVSNPRGMIKRDQIQN